MLLDSRLINSINNNLNTVLAFKFGTRPVEGMEENSYFTISVVDVVTGSCIETIDLEIFNTIQDFRRISNAVNEIRCELQIFFTSQHRTFVGIGSTYYGDPIIYIDYSQLDLSRIIKNGGYFRCTYYDNTIPSFYINLGPRRFPCRDTEPIAFLIKNSRFHYLLNSTSEESAALVKRSITKELEDINSKIVSKENELTECLVKKDNLLMNLTDSDKLILEV